MANQLPEPGDENLYEEGGWHCSGLLDKTGFLVVDCMTLQGIDSSRQARSDHWSSSGSIADEQDVDRASKATHALHKERDRKIARRRARLNETLPLGPVALSAPHDAWDPRLSWLHDEVTKRA